MTHYTPSINTAAEDFKNLRVLIAEDNEVNQLLAKSILQYWGLEAKTATTGTEVMDLMEQEEFDMVLMDIQMPEKSGIEAAREIRKLADPRKRNIPIIALTANALKGEEKKYIAVGMDDFLTKPFKEQELYEVIERVLKNEGTFCRPKVTDAKDSFSLAVNEVKVYDMGHLNDLFDNNRDLIISLVKIFIETLPETCTEILNHLANGNIEDVGKLAHKIKPSLDSMHMHSIKNDIRNIELFAKQKINLNDIPSLCHKVIGTIEIAVIQLKKEFEL
jgi:CheY-like chemotaxis protein/HPt (histidine-containing phosphotransfer) domain-containing protein